MVVVQGHARPYNQSMHNSIFKNFQNSIRLCFLCILQWWNERGFLSNTFITFLYSVSIALSIELFVNDQLLKQYLHMWKKIIEYKYNLTAPTVKKDLIYLKLFKLIFTILDNFLHGF